MTKKVINPSSTFDIWSKYQIFINGLHLEDNSKKITGKKKIINYVYKLVAVFIGSLFTTITFYFLIDPNGLYNSGLNGFLQSISRWATISGKIQKISYYSLYFGLGFLINLIFIFFLWFFFNAQIDIISTSLFYVISQFIWTKIFNYFKFRDYIFNHFNPSNWKESSQMSFVLPYYIVIAIFAAIIHTYGYNLIFQNQSTPGGLEIITSYFSKKKNKKISMSFLIKLSGFIVIFITTLFNFFLVENNLEMKKKTFYNKIKIVENLKTDEEVDFELEKWTNKMREAIYSGEKEKWKIKDEYIELTKNIEKIIGSKVEENPQDLSYYLVSDQKKILLMKDELEKLIWEISLSSSLPSIEKKIKRKEYLKNQINKLEKTKKNNVLKKYLTYVTNDLSLWATIFYIYFCSIFVNNTSSSSEEINEKLKNE